MKPALRVALALGASLVLLALSNGQATAQTETARDVVADSARDIERGAFSEAIEKLELWADRGAADPDVSFNRGVAYLERARTATAKPGDRGRAIAGFAEALALRPNDRAAQEALSAADSELEKIRARERGSRNVAGPAVRSLLVELLTENAWAKLAALASLLTTLGLTIVALTRKGSAEIPASPWRLAGAVLASVGALCLVVTGSASWLARHGRLSEVPAVVVTSSAQPLDEHGRPTRGSALGEGTRLDVLETRERLVLVSHGGSSVWLHRGDVQTLRTPSYD